MKPKTKKREYKTVTLLGVKNLKQDGDTGSGTAIFAQFDVRDHDWDVTRPGAFGIQPVKLLGSHNWTPPPIGKGATREDSKYALVDFHMNLRTTLGKDWYEALKFDMDPEIGPALQEWSYGYFVEESEYGDHDGDRVRFLKKIKVFEVSPVVLGAGIGTRTITVKARKGWCPECDAELSEADRCECGWQHQESSQTPKDPNPAADEIYLYA